MADPVVADITTGAATSAEPVAEKKKHRRPRCYRCNKWGHRGAECPKRKQAAQTDDTELPKESANASAQAEASKLTATASLGGIQIPALITLSQAGIDTIVGNIHDIVNSAVQVAVQRALEFKARDGTPANANQGTNTGVAVDEGSVSASVRDLASSVGDVNLTGCVDQGHSATAQENTSAPSVDAQAMPAAATDLEIDDQAVQDGDNDEESESEEDFHVQV